jgi:hypothetical protein
MFFYLLKNFNVFFKLNFIIFLNLILNLNYYFITIFICILHQLYPDYLKSKKGYFIKNSQYMINWKF